MTKLKLRRAKKRERPAVARLMAQLYAASGGDGSEKKAARRLDLLLGAGYEPWVALRGGEVAGYALADENGDHVFIRHFVVDAAQRGKGVGRALFEALDEEYGAPQFRLDVLDGREDARAFWTRLGFAPKAVSMRRDAS